MSIISEAFSAWRECRAEYDDTLYAQYMAAEEATNGAMLNARGREKGIDPFTLSAILEANIAHSLATVEEKEWAPNRDVTLERLRIVDMIHEGKPACRLCGQTANYLDKFGLCSKVSDAHKEWRGDPVPRKKKAGAR